MTESPGPLRGPLEPTAPAGVPTWAKIQLGVAVAFLGLFTQIFLRRQLAPSEFGTVHTILGAVTIAAAPFLGLRMALGPMLGDETGLGHGRRLLEAGGLLWGGVSMLALFVCLPLLDLPRIPLEFFAILTAGATFLAIYSSALATPKGWAALLLIAVILRGVASVGFSHFAPSAQSGLGAVLLAGMVLAIPTLRLPPHTVSLREAWTEFQLRGLLLPTIATISAALTVALFTNADRMLAQACFVSHVGLNFVPNDTFDDYQAAGWVARGAVWCGLPLLFIFYSQRSALGRTSVASMRYFGFYLAACAALFLLVPLGKLISFLFQPNDDLMFFLPGFAAAFFLIGLIQGVAVFAVASRRYLECFLILACSLGDTALLACTGRQPQLMIAAMFWGALITLAFVLLIGVIRYARSHP